jgi:hypothetical protein
MKQQTPPEIHETRDDSNESCFTKSQTAEIPLKEWPTPRLNSSEKEL